MEAHEIVQQARDAGVQLVTFAYCDNGGIIRLPGHYLKV